MAQILIVDDSNFARRVLRSILESDGHSVVEATDGMSALEQVGAHPPDLLMLDLTMAGMNGLEVLLQVRQLRPELPVLVASADVQRPTRQLANEGGAQGFIPKPFIAEDVLARVDQVLTGVSAW